MFQDFSNPPASAGDPAKIEALRQVLKDRELAGFLIPRADEHQGEYVPPHAERLSWLTGFTGSAGMAAVLTDEAAIFVDGRYTLQAEKQVATDVITPIHTADQTMSDWLVETMEAGDTLAFDPWLHTISEINKLEEKLTSKGMELQAVENLVDVIWQDQPTPPDGPVKTHPIEFAGQESAEKIANAQEVLKEKDVSAFLLTQPDSICWLLNIRGWDVPHTPLVLAFALIKADGEPVLFLDEDRIPADIRQSVKAICAPRGRLLSYLADIEGQIGIDPSTTPQIFKKSLEEAAKNFKEMEDPCLLPKAMKNAVEQEGTRAAHIRDGVAVVHFLHWLDTQNVADLTEIKAAQKLEACRSAIGNAHGTPLQDISFDTISGFGANGAIVHYRVTEESNATFEADSLYLIDSGGQYQDGTTDITRTVAIGIPSDAMRRHFTLVLKGMIAVSRARFPKGASGAQVDTLARHALWQAGFDFDHGTGHGVGSFLGVHEGPQRISKVSTVPLKTGMILSNEPGYYETGSHGIRIENLVLVNEPEPIEGGSREMMGFETITFVPIDRRAIDVSLLDDGELVWLDIYHQEVFAKLSPHLPDAEKEWLQQACAPLKG